MNLIRLTLLLVFLATSIIINNGCNFVTHRTVSVDSPYDSNKSDQDPNYNVSLDYKYQDFISYFYMGNRVENFTAYFNTFFKSQEDFNEGYNEYRTSLISFYNKRLDSLGINPPISGSVKDKLDKAIERSSKIIQYHKNSKYIDDAVLIIGKSYYFEAEYFKAERTFNEFLSKFSSSILADEAILYLGQTKVRLDKKEEGEVIFKNLLKNSDQNEIQSLAARNLGIIEFNKARYEDAVNYFKQSIKFSNDNERKAEGQFILAKILSVYKPQLAAEEYKKVLDYSSDYDLKFYTMLNYSKGLIVNKNYKAAAEELEDMRSKYRDEPGFTPLIDLEIANNLYAENNIPKAFEKYYEVIVKYPGTNSSADAYYYLAKYDEEVRKDFLNALVNYKKSVEESSSSDYFKYSQEKSATLEKYFTLKSEVLDSGKVEIPTVNTAVENYRRKYNEEKGIEQAPDVSTGKDNENRGFENNGNQNGNPDDGNQKGNGKGKPGGFRFDRSMKDDSLKQQLDNPEDNPNNLPTGNNPAGPDRNPSNIKKGEEPKVMDEKKDTLDTRAADSIKAAEELTLIKNKEDKVFNAYYQLAELFMYSMPQNDSAEHYLKLLLTKFPESDKQMKILYTLGYFYKNTNRQTEADETFEKIISTYPNSIYASESRKILGIKSSDEKVIEKPIDEIFTIAFNFLVKNKYQEAIDELKLIEEKYPEDTLIAKSLYGIGWIYENKLVNKDSSLLYYNKLTGKYPESEYAQKVLPMLEYIASVEPKEKQVLDSTGVNPAVSDSTKNELKEAPTGEESVDTKKEENPEEVKADTTNVTGETKLSQEEINKLLKESEGK
ncbi:MAG TPA: tetratricopeptide repeat protein [Ignavibacteria bacterium]|nr:tetratricopeptide repeat protein [Ignavibacteria bacterium]